MGLWRVGQNGTVCLSSSCQEMSDIREVTKLDAQQQVDPGLRIQPRHMRKQLQNCKSQDTFH